MLSVIAAMLVGVCSFPVDPQAPPQTNQAGDGVPSGGEVLGNGYVRKGGFIYFDGQRIDQAGKEDIGQFAKFIGRDLNLATGVDAASFKALSEEYTKDKNKVYYKWISPGRFWVVELPQADVPSFEVLGFNFAKDSKHAWWYGKQLPNIDPATVEMINDGFVWKDANNVWYQHEKIPGADAATFRHLGQAFYRDKDRVYWSSTPLSGADPDTFRTFGDDSPYGADQMNVWRASSKVVGVDAASFEAIHQSVYKDKNGVYANGYAVEKADPTTFRKVADIDEYLTALLADDENYYVFLAYRGEIYRVVPTRDSLIVERQIWAPGTPQHQTNGVEPVAIAAAELTMNGWRKQSVMVNDATDANQMTKDQEVHLLNLHESQFVKAWEILRGSPQGEMTTDRKASEEGPAAGNLSSKDWRTDVAAFDKFLSEFVANGRVPDKAALTSRVTLPPGGGKVDSEVIPVTDGAGGFIDTRPAEDTVQYLVNQALKGQGIEWEFTLKNYATASFGGVVSLVPSLSGNTGPYLGSIFVRPAANQKAAIDFRAGDSLKLRGTIGDFVENKELASRMSPTGTAAIYHLDSAPHTVFWVGLTDVKIAGPSRKTPALLGPAADVTAFVKALLQASFGYDEQALKQMYASEVRLLPGNRLFQYGLKLPRKMTSHGVMVERENMLPALKKQADRSPAAGAMVAMFVSLFRIEQVDVSAGGFATDPNQPSDSVFEKLRFTIEENDVLIKISVPSAFRYLQLRHSGEQWKVVAEY